jgi:Recombination endonuclease VII
MIQCLSMKRKKCTRCGISKRLDAFCIDRPRRDGRYARCKECVNKAMRERYRETGPRAYQKRPYMQTREGKLRAKYGITLADYEKLLKRQGHACAICRKPAVHKLLQVDHCHSTGRVRGLLCSRCNLALAALGDTIKAIKRALAHCLGR